MDVESSPDADTPRPIGVGLLLCMLERGGEAVAQSLIALAASMQQNPTPDAVLMREACYRWACVCVCILAFGWYVHSDHGCWVTYARSVHA